MTYYATETVMVMASPDKTWRVLTNLAYLPQWYVPAQGIEILTPGEVRVGWQFYLAVKTLPGVVLRALGTVKEFDPQNRVITWHGQATGINGDSRWQVQATSEGGARIEHTFEGQGWLMWLSHFSGRNRLTVQKRLANLKRLVESETF